MSDQILTLNCDFRRTSSVTKKEKFELYLSFNSCLLICHAQNEKVNHLSEWSLFYRSFCLGLKRLPIIANILTTPPHIFGRSQISSSTKIIMKSANNKG